MWMAATDLLPPHAPAAPALHHCTAAAAFCALLTAASAPARRFNLGWPAGHARRPGCGIALTPPRTARCHLHLRPTIPYRRALGRHQPAKQRQRAPVAKHALRQQQPRLVPTAGMRQRRAWLPGAPTAWVGARQLLPASVKHP